MRISRHVMKKKQIVELQCSIQYIAFFNRIIYSLFAYIGITANQENVNVHVSFMPL